MEVTDGSSLGGLQVVLNPESTAGWELLEEGAFATGASIIASGEIVASVGGKQTVRSHHPPQCSTPSHRRNKVLYKVV
jgi:hypothetical protein